MRPTELSALVQRPRDTSHLTAMASLMLLLVIGHTGGATFGPQRIIQKPDADGLVAVFAADLDGDGDKDVLSASRFDSKIAWYENLTTPNAALRWEFYD